ncbi:hypothetical protein FOZ62_022955 [Perkinsus olseni]|uniref:Uncharacterized protein n=1 Tax=Perkinsus olseni TaxID=32597 RepID=A0A7J6QZU2_PEROL|nr:hypothetical protein FOZ62_022955 [Perkinsus olseni]
MLYLRRECTRRQVRFLKPDQGRWRDAHRLAHTNSRIIPGGIAEDPRPSSSHRLSHFKELAGNLRNDSGGRQISPRFGPVADSTTKTNNNDDSDIGVLSQKHLLRS